MLQLTVCVWITSLVSLYGCPLQCKYCINDRLRFYKITDITAEELYKEVEQDDLYYCYTKGGICFGGHEPLLQADFVKEFVEYVRKMKKPWKITVETSLNVNHEEVMKLIQYVDYWIVDIKDMNPDIYFAYTGKTNANVLENLKILKENHVPLRLRLPLIPEYNTKDDRSRSIAILKDMGFSKKDMELFTYKVIEKRA